MRAKGSSNGGKQARVSIGFDAMLFEDICAVADARGITFNAAVRALCHRGLKAEGSTPHALKQPLGDRAKKASERATDGR